MSKPGNEPSYDLVLKGGRVIDERNHLDGRFDVALKGGRIAAVAPAIEAGSAAVRDVAGCIIAPGLIDIHTHVYHKATSLSVDPGFIARRSACTTLVDAGNISADDVDLIHVTDDIDEIVDIIERFEANRYRTAPTE